MSIAHHLFRDHSRSAPQLVIGLHCSASSSRQWDGYGQLLPAGMRLVAAELIGYGSGEGWTPGAAVSLESEARRLGPLLFSAPGGAHLVGHSYGGAVALQMALLWPDRVKTLSLFEPVRFALLQEDREHEAIWKAIVSVGRRIGWHALSGQLDQAASLFVDYWSGAGAWERLPTARRRAIAERMPKVRAEFEALFADAEPARSYNRLKMPVRLITGSTSPLPARKVAEVITHQCAQAELVQLDGVGHMGPISHAPLVAARLAFQPHQAQTLPLAA